jgi:gluconate 2-dehydrogenase gamma chain
MPKRSDPPTDVGAIDRRTFLRRTAGALAVLAVQGAFRLDAQAQEEVRLGYLFFTREEGALVEALAGRIWPGSASEPGAVEAGAVTYIDRALAGPYAEYQRAYRVLLHELDGEIRRRHGGSAPDLDDAQLDQLLGELEAGRLGAAAWADTGSRRIELGLGPASPFGMLRTHVLEGVFSDPVHGGNRDFAGWRAVGYPGAHYVYSAEEQQVFEPLTKPYQSVADL